MSHSSFDPPQGESLQDMVQRTAGLAKAFRETETPSGYEITYGAAFVGKSFSSVTLFQRVRDEGIDPSTLRFRTEQQLREDEQHGC